MVHSSALAILDSDCRFRGFDSRFRCWFTTETQTPVSLIYTAWPNKLAGVGAGRTPEFIEMMEVGHGCWSGAARGALGLVTTMKTFVFLFLSCASLLGADEGIRMVTTTKTNTSAPDYVLTLSVFTRDGQTNLVRSILTRPDKVESPSHKFYHDGFLVGEIKSIANFYVFTGAADCPYSLEGYYRTNGGVWQAAICTKDGVVLDYFTATNGLFWPAPRSEIQNLSKMTTAMNRQHAKALENIPK